MRTHIHVVIALVLTISMSTLSHADVVEVPVSADGVPRIDLEQGTKAEAPHRAIVAGATGAVGRMAVHNLALNPSVEYVTALTRSHRGDAAAMFNLTAEYAAKVRWVVVDYEKLLDEGAGSEQLAGHTIGATGLGLYTEDAESEEHFRRVEIGYNTAVAKASGATRFTFLSTVGACDGSWMMFARVKADAEHALCELPGMITCASMRPGLIMDRPTGMRSWIERPLTWLSKNLWLAEAGFAVTADEIGKAMVHSLLCPADQVMRIYKNNDIREMSYGCPGTIEQ